MKIGPSAPRVWLNPVAVWELLDRLDISQNQLARLAGISPGHLSLLMNGKRSPAPRVRRRLMQGPWRGRLSPSCSSWSAPPLLAGRRERPSGPAPPNAKNPHT